MRCGIWYYLHNLKNVKNTQFNELEHQYLAIILQKVITVLKQYSKSPSFAT